MIAQRIGIKGLDEYETGSEQLAGLGADDEDDVPLTGTEERRLQVMQWQAATGGG